MKVDVEEEEVWSIRPEPCMQIIEAMAGRQRVMAQDANGAAEEARNGGVVVDDENPESPRGGIELARHATLVSGSSPTADGCGCPVPHAMSGG